MAAQVDGRVAALDGVAALDKPVTLRLRAASLREVLARVQQMTGVQLRPSRDVAEDKATVRAKDRPAREVLCELAKCFDLCWSNKDQDDKPCLYLWMDKRSLQNMDQRTYEDYLAIYKQFDQQMQMTATCIRSGSSYEISDNERQSLSRDDLERASLRQAEIATPTMAAAVLQYFSLTDQQRKDLLSGKHVVVPRTSMSTETTEKWPEAKSLDFWVDSSVGGYLLKCGRQPDDGSTRLLTTAIFDDSRYDKAIRAANEAILKDASLDGQLPAPKASPVSKAPDTGSERVVAGDRAAGQPMVDPEWPTVPRPGDGSGALPATMSDGLLEIADALDLQLVAQYLSEYNGQALNGGMRSAAPSAAKKANDRIAELSLLHRFTVERDGKFLLAKSLLWHRLRARETPEDTIRKWQREITGLSAPTFGVASEMVAMPWDKIGGAITNQDAWFGSMNIVQLAQGLYGLRLYNSLSSEQRRLADSGAEVPCASMSQSQLRTFMQGYELRREPTYDQAKGPNWVADAGFTVKLTPGESALAAVSGMRRLGQIEVIYNVTREVSNSDDKPVPDSELQAQEQSRISEAAGKLLPAVCAAHPEIKPTAVGIYGTRWMTFTFRLGESTRSSILNYSVKH